MRKLIFIILTLVLLTAYSTGNETKILVTNNSDLDRKNELVSFDLPKTSKNKHLVSLIIRES
jgi:hypothetical protein